MVKRRKNNSKKTHNGKGFKENGAKAGKISASTVYETCREQLSPFGVLLASTKFWVSVMINLIKMTMLMLRKHCFLSQSPVRK